MIQPDYSGADVISSAVWTKEVKRVKSVRNKDKRALPLLLQRVSALRVDRMPLHRHWRRGKGVQGTAASKKQRQDLLHRDLAPPAEPPKDQNHGREHQGH
jgi:hypothetical protein